MGLELRVKQYAVSSVLKAAFPNGHSASCDDVEMVSENQSEHETQDANTC